MVQCDKYRSCVVSCECVSTGRRTRSLDQALTLVACVQRAIRSGEAMRTPHTAERLHVCYRESLRARGVAVEPVEIAWRCIDRTGMRAEYPLLHTLRSSSPIRSRLWATLGGRRHVRKSAVTCGVSTLRRTRSAHTRRRACSDLRPGRRWPSSCRTRGRPAASSPAPGTWL